MRSTCRSVVLLVAIGFLLAAASPSRAATLGTTKLVVGPAVGTNSVVLAEGGPWTAVPNDTWLHLDNANQSGTGSTNVLFTYDANADAAPRVGTLTVDGMTLTVMQAGANYVATSNPIPLVSSGLSSPSAVAVDALGNVYFTDTDQDAVYKLQAGTTNVTTLVSSGLSNPIGVAADASGNVYIADPSNGAVYAWHPGDPATLPGAIFSYAKHQPNGVAVDGSGKLYIADAGYSTLAGDVFNQGIRVLDGLPGSTNYTTLVSTGFTDPLGVAVDEAGNVYFADLLSSPGIILKAQPGSSSATPLFQASRPWGTAVDGSGNVYVTGQLADSIWAWQPAQPQTQSLLVVGAGGYGGSGGVFGVAVDASGNVYYSDAGANSINVLPNAFVEPTPKSLSGASGMGALPPVVPASFSLSGPLQPKSNQPWLTITSTDNGVVSYRFDANFGTSSRTAQITLLGQSILFTQDIAVVTNVLGRTYALEGPDGGSDTVLLKVSEPGAPWVASTTTPWLHLDAANQSGAGSATVTFSFDPNTGATRTGALTIAGLTLTVTQAGSTYVLAQPLTSLISSGLSFPSAVAVDEEGSVYIADQNNHAIKKWQPGSPDAVTVLATLASSEAPNGVGVDAEGNVYFTESHGSNPVNYALKQWQPGVTPTITSLVDSGTNRLLGVAVDGAGNVFFANSTANQVQEWQPGSTPTVTTPISNYTGPAGVAVDAAGNLFVAFPAGGVISGTVVSGSVRKFPSGSTTVTPLLNSGLSSTEGVAVDGAGNVYIADSGNNRILVMPPDYSRNTALVNSGLSFPNGVAVDSAGNVYIADSANNAIKELPYAFVDTTAKDVSNIAGTDTLAAVLPTTANLSGPFTPTSDQAWLTITSTNNGVVSFSFTENDTGNTRAANITVLGQTITVTQTGFPVVSTQAATDVGGFSATLNGTVNPVNAQTTYWFEYGTSTLYGSSTPSVILAAGAAAEPVTSLLTGLVAGTTYHFRVVAQNSTGTRRGSDSTFTTVAVPATLGAASLVIGPTGSRGSVVVVGNGSWATSTADAWLHFDAVSTPGSGQTNVFFRYDDNNGPTRTGTLTIGGQTVIVTQAGSGFVRAGAVELFSSALRPAFLSVNAPGNLYLAFDDDFRIWNWRGAGDLRLVTSRPSVVKSIAVDASGSVYFYDGGTGQIGEFSSGTGNSLSASVLQAAGPAVDPSGNAYFINTSSREIYKWIAANSALDNVGSYTSGNPFALAVDAAGNLYFTDTSANSIQRLNATNYTMSKLIDGPPLNLDGSSSLWGLGVDGSGNVYYGGGQALLEWNASSQSSSSRADAGAKIYGVAVDAEGNVYYVTDPSPANAGPGIGSTVFELPRVWVSQPSSSVLHLGGGSGTLMVAPSTSNLSGPGAPVSDQPWLTVTGVANGVVNYSVSANDSGAARVGHITILGASLPITQSSPPLVFNASATGIGLTTATLNAFVFPQGTETSYWFEYGYSTSYGNSTTTNVLPASMSGVAIATPATGLSLNSTYHFRIVATNIDGRVDGPDLTFVTREKVPPKVTTQAATDVTTTTATLNATVNPGADDTTYWFQYWTTSAYGQTPAGQLAVGTSDSSVSAQLTGLTPGKQYYFRIVAVNSLTEADGAAVTFTTTSAALATSNLVVDSPAGSDSVTVAPSNAGGSGTGRIGLHGATPAGTWEASTTASWLHLSPENQAGVGSTNVVFTFDANPGPTRSDTITIAGEILTVTQAGAAYVPAARLTPLISSGLSSPTGLEVDADGNLYIADTGNNAIKKWTPSSRIVTTLVSEGLSSPSGVAVDIAGNVYIADRDHSVVKQWQSGSQAVSSLLSDGLSAPHDVAVDAAGRVYVADFGNAAVKQFNGGNQTTNTLVAAGDGLVGALSVALDHAGNVYIADTNHSIMSWNQANHTVSTLVPSLPLAPRSVAVDASGNVYFPDHANRAINMWNVAGQNLISLVTAGLTSPAGVAVDSQRNLFVSDDATGMIHELPHAFVDVTPRTVPALAGTDALPGVLPQSANLKGPFAPTSDQPWLTISGVTNGVVSFSFTANDSAVVRVAHINLLGHSVAIGQGPASFPLTIDAAASAQAGTPGGSFTIKFTGAPMATYRVLASTDVGMPVGQWQSLGTATEDPAGSGRYQFTDTTAAEVAKFYILVGH